MKESGFETVLASAAEDHGINLKDLLLLSIRKYSDRAVCDPNGVSTGKMPVARASSPCSVCQSFESVTIKLDTQ